MRPFSQDFTSSPQRLKGSAGAGQTRRVTSRVTLDCLSEAGACRPKGGGPLGEVGSVAKDAAGLLSGAAVYCYYGCRGITVRRVLAQIGCGVGLVYNAMRHSRTCSSAQPRPTRAPRRMIVSR
jgi:hypothetical protein